MTTKAYTERELIGILREVYNKLEEELAIIFGPEKTWTREDKIYFMIRFWQRWPFSVRRVMDDMGAKKQMEILEKAFPEEDQPGRENNEE